MTQTENRFWAKVNKRTPRRGRRGFCWVWTAAKNENGYGVFFVGSRTDGTRRMVLAYHWLWEQEHGPVPEGMELDHLCRHRACVRPSHLESVTHLENVRRGDTAAMDQYNANKTHCPAGHPYDSVNTYIWPKGERNCRTCRNERARRYYQRKKETAA